MSSDRVTLSDTLSAIQRTGSVSEPVTTSEIAEELETTQRTAYSKLEQLAEQGAIQDKKVGARNRIWWIDDATPNQQEFKSESEQAKALNRISNGFCALDEQFRFTYINDRACALLGLNSSAIGARLHDEIDLTDDFETALRDAVETVESVCREDYYESVDAWFESAIYPSETGVSVYFRDITKRKRLEQELRTEKEHFRVALQNAPIVAFRLDTDLRYTWIGSPHEDFEDMEVIGKRDDDLLPPEPAEKIMAPKRKALATGEPVREEVTYELPSGMVSYDLAVEPLRDESGEIVALTCSSLDITERKEREQTLEEQNERLEQFATMLAHELRNPVAIGQIYTQRLSDADETIAEYITEAFDRIENMVDMMLMLTRGRGAVSDSTQVQLRAAVRETWEELETTDASLTVEGDFVFEVDETFARHFFRNLFENAIEHGGADVTVKVGELPNGFFIADTGSGIPAGEREEVLEPGYTTTAEQGGTGLGLTFVREFAEVYGWEYAVTESAAGGARFEFTNIE
ncbi:PAS domain-containing protein [Haloarcula amylovorans]|uniref:PAS domain-containing protein n=1 Tax=Haloarcula amylovorans TaxID=2562280 RepID=UPI0010760FBC|nr:PAS domain-containing protein [Halomicroarcula amylolytica]